MKQNDLELTNSSNTINWFAAQNSLNSGDGTEESEVSYNHSARLWSLGSLGLLAKHFPFLHNKQ